jgi:hypothetical protein
MATTKKAQKLNRKLCEWVGFNLSCFSHGLAWFINNKTLYCQVGDEQKADDCLPHLTNSVDACLTWLLPQLKVVTMTNGFKGWVVSLNMGDKKYVGEHDKLAMAFCLAVEKLIDGKEGL